MIFDEFNEYDKKMREYEKQLSDSYDDEWNKLYEKVSKYQQNYMENILEEYKKTINCKAKEYIYDLLCYAVRQSESGSSIIDVETEEIANEIDNIIWEEIGDYLLDCQIYEKGGHWAIDCMFAGYYVPYWDGWSEE